jgi:hypothetical protein
LALTIRPSGLAEKRRQPLNSSVSRSRSMTVHLRLGFFALLFLPTMAQAAGLCSVHEVTYFSCQTTSHKRTVSLCGSSISTSGESGLSHNEWLQYRFGTSQKIDLIYPKDKANSVAKFSSEYHHPYHEFWNSVSFTNHNILYTVVAFAGVGDGFFGVWVHIPGKKIVKIPCSELPRRSDFSNLVWFLGRHGKSG